MNRFLRPGPPLSLPCSAEFLSACNRALATAKLHPDQAVAYAATVVPVFAQPRPDQAQAEAGGCADCVYLGLWASHWPGYEPSDHGIIWLFEDGIRANTPGSLVDKTDEVLVHELGHALNRDHVLEAARAEGKLLGYRGAYDKAARPCATCGGT